MGFRQVAAALIAQVQLAAIFTAFDLVCDLNDSCHVFFSACHCRAPGCSPKDKENKLTIPQLGQVYTLRRIDHIVSKLDELESLSTFS
ncbi:MAG: hypothetical protein ACJAVI_003703 [Candidatus Azotimanducaceae bacterium]|jgi:hypothetical protein